MHFPGHMVSGMLLEGVGIESICGFSVKATRGRKSLLDLLMPACFFQLLRKIFFSCLSLEPVGSGVTVPAVHSHCCSPLAISIAGDALQDSECEREISQTSPMESSVCGCGSC